MPSPSERLEQSFVSAVLYLHDDEGRIAGFLDMLERQLSNKFAHYEYVVVDDRCSDGTVGAVRSWATGTAAPLTIVHMSVYQGLEIAMNAGVDCAIGDWIFEFDVPEASWPESLLVEAFERASAGNRDIVSVCPGRQHLSSRLFYGVFNRHSSSAYELRTDAFRLVSRRAHNRARAVAQKHPYRKAAYADCGLAMEDVVYPGKLASQREGRRGTAVDALVLYTHVGYRVALALIAVMVLLSLAEVAYAVSCFLGGFTVTGWFTTMIVMTLGFLGLFAMLAVILKYLDLILNLSFRRQINLVEGVERIQR